MFLSANEIEDGDRLKSDVVVVGSGATGIPMALELADAGVSVILLEAGSKGVSKKQQSIYSGKVVDPSLHPPADKYRQRRLGGTTPIWGGRCVPFDSIDFEARDYIPHSGWPISIDDLDSYCADANEWFEAGEFLYRSSQVFGDRVPPLINGFESDIVSIDSMERFSRPTDLYRRYRDRLEASSNLKVVFGGSCTKICLSESGESVDKLTVSTLEKRVFYISAEDYVLAAGGIETARLMLASNDVQKEGVGNQNDVVGRYYMCHIAGNVGSLKFNGSRNDIRHGYEISPEGIYCRRRISLTESEQRRRKVGNVVFRLHFPRIADASHKSGVLSFLYLIKSFISYEYATRLRDGDGDTLRSMLLHVRNVLLSPFETARFLLHWMRKRTFASRKFPSIILENKTNKFSLEVHGEHGPDWNSRVYLSEEVDEFGMPRVVIDWKYSRQDIESVRETLKVFASELDRLGIGELEFDDSVLETNLLRFGAYGGHHIGTTRMGTDTQTSVVDQDCKVHGVSNLYVAGSAVFPTSGQANPTLLGTALALRLADHLCDRRIGNSD
jgi:choline dehydrogenase-like flavoprotein